LPSLLPARRINYSGCVQFVGGTPKRPLFDAELPVRRMTPGGKCCPTAAVHLRPEDQQSWVASWRS
jgi:hypothetical protein